MGTITYKDAGGQYEGNGIRRFADFQRKILPQSTPQKTPQHQPKIEHRPKIEMLERGCQPRNRHAIYYSYTDGDSVHGFYG